MADEERALLTLDGDASGAVKAITNTDKALKDLNKQSDKTASAAEELNRQFAQLRADQIKALNADLSKQQSLLERNAQSAQTRDLFKDDFGDTSTGLGALASAINSVAGAGAGEAAAIVGDIAGFVEYLPALTSSLASAGAVILPIAAIGGSIAVAVNQIIEANRALDESVAASIRANADINRQIAEGLTTEEAQARLDELNRLRDAENKTLEETQANYSAAFDKAVEAAGGDLGGRLAFAFVQATSGAEEESQTVINEARANAQKYTAEIERLTQAIENGETIANDAAAQTETRNLELEAQEKQLTAERERASQTIEQLAQQENDLIAAYDQRIRQQEEDRNRAADRASEDLARSEQRRAEDLNRALELGQADHQDRLTQIADNGAKQIEDANRQLAEKIADITTRRAELESDYLDELGDIEDKYRKQALDDAQDFADKRADIERDYQDTINDPGLTVKGLIEAEKDRKRALEDVDKEQKKAEQSRAEQLEEEKQKTAENHAERLSQLDTELAKAQEQTALRVAEIETQTQAAIDSERLTFAEKLQLDADTRAITKQREEEDRALRLARQEEDQRIQDQRAADAHNAALMRIDERQLKEQTLADSISASLDALIVKAQSISPTAPLPVVAPTLPNPALSNITNAVNGFLFPSLPAPSNGGVVVNVTGNTIGDIATTRDLDALGEYVATRVQNGIRRGRAN